MPSDRRRRCAAAETRLTLDGPRSTTLASEISIEGSDIGAHRALTVGFLLLSLDQPRKIPAVRIALDMQHWLIDLDLLEVRP